MNNQNNSSAPELLPCPFCGNEAPSIHDSYVDCQGYMVLCASCTAEGPLCTSEKEAAAEWNRREPPIDRVQGGLTEKDRETLNQIACWLDSSARIVQNGPDDYGPASEFDYELGQAAAEISAILSRQSMMGRYMESSIALDAATDNLYGQNITTPANAAAANGDIRKPDAWLVPSILSFENRRASCPVELVGQLEGTVAWEAALFSDGDIDAVTDKHGVEHKPIPLYRAAADADGQKGDAA